MAQMRTDIAKKTDGLYWPITDTVCQEWSHGELYSVNEVVSVCKNKRVIIHAGANVGVYSLKFAESFETVIAFEPDTTNFKCLALNTINTNNIFLYQAALGCFAQPISLNNIETNNCGTSAINGKGIIPQITIDSLGLDTVDCIHLDTEGYELFAIMGALNTINKCSPAIVIEWMGHSKKYNIPPETIIGFLSGLGYNKMKKVASDMVFIK
jgi:FkbM family methyltransferase